jgi:predicted amidohydrolase YtcJ
MAEERRHAALALLNGKIITCDRQSTIAQAVAVDGERTAAVGRNSDIQSLIGPETRVIDLQGRAVIPGLVDAHAHMDREGLKEVMPSMAGLRSVEAIVERIAALAAQARPGEWIVTMPLGDPPEYDLAEADMTPGQWPTRHDLDRAAPHNPVYIKPAWGYWRSSLPLVSIANTAALERASITRDTQAPCDSVTIDRDGDGMPTGIFYETNRMPVLDFTLFRQAPAFDLATRVAALPRSMEIYNSFGTTSVFEGHGVAEEVVEAYKSVGAAGQQTVRATLAFSPAWPDGNADIKAMIADWARWIAHKGIGDEWLRINGLFSEIDTTPENRIRALAFPQTGWAGFNYTGLPEEAVRTLLIECARNGVRVIAIAANMLDLFAEAAKVAPIAGQRWVLAHITALDDRKIGLLRDHGVVTTTHTNNYIWRGGARFRDSLGPGRENEVVPLRRLLDAGVPVGLGTDNVPVSLWNPIWQAVARKDRNTGEPVAPAQALTREEALHCATMGGAYLTFEENEKGSLEKGKLADAVVLSQDPLTCDTDALRETRAFMTIVGGRIVYERKAA